MITALSWLLAGWIVGLSLFVWTSSVALWREGMPRTATACASVSLALCVAAVFLVA